MLPNVPNFRQLKGTKIYRSSKPDRMGEEDVEIAQNQLGIKTIVDLRSKVEGHATKPVYCDDFYTKCNLTQSTRIKSDGPRDEFCRYLVNLVNLEFGRKCIKECSIFLRILFYALVLVDKLFKTSFLFPCFAKIVLKEPCYMYQRILMFCGHGEEGISSVLRNLSEPNAVPAMICCAHGKDRTGVICALIHGLMGRSIDFIAKDYAESEEGLRSIRSDVEADIKKVHLSSAFLETKYETMVNLMEFVHSRYGSVSDYLSSVGFGLAEQAAFRKNIAI